MAHAEHNPAPRLALSIPELADALGLDRATVYRKLKSGVLDIPVFRLDGSTRVRVVDVEAFLERLVDEVQQPTPSIVRRRRNG